MGFVAKIFGGGKKKPKPQKVIYQQAPARPAQSSEMASEPRPKQPRRRSGTRTNFGGLSTEDTAASAKKTLLGE